MKIISNPTLKDLDIEIMDTPSHSGQLLETSSVKDRSLVLKTTFESLDKSPKLDHFCDTFPARLENSLWLESLVGTFNQMALVTNFERECFEERWAQIKSEKKL